MAGDKLYIKGEAPSEAVKNDVLESGEAGGFKLQRSHAGLSAPQAQAAAAGADATASAGGKTYTVVAGDSLGKISQHFYGKASEYMKIFNANKNVISDPDKIKPGMTLVIPD